MKSSLGSQRVRTQAPKKNEKVGGEGTRERDTCDGASVGDESLAARPVKVRPVVDRGALARCAPEHAGLPRVEVRVKVNDGDRTVRAVDRAKQRQHDRVVPPERDHPRVMLPVLRDRHERRARQRVVRQRRERRPVQQLPVSVLDLLDRERVVVRRHGDVPAIDDLQPGQKRIDLQRHVVPAVQRQPSRSCADSRRSEACARSVRRSGVLSGASTRAVPSVNCGVAGGAACGGGGEIYESDLQGLTNGAPRNAISNGTSFSFVRH